MTVMKRLRRTQNSVFKTQGRRLLLSTEFWVFSLLVIGIFMQAGLAYGKAGAPDRDYRIAVVLFNEAEYDNAELKFSTVIQKGDLSIPDAAAYVVNSYYGRASCRIEQGRAFKSDGKLTDALGKYEKAYEDLVVFKSKFEELQDTMKSDPLYDEMEKHFVTISDQMVQLAGEAGDICANQGAYAKAIEWYDNGLLFIDSWAPAYGDMLYAKADAVFQLNRYEETLDLLSDFEDELSDHKMASNAMFYAGDIHRLMAEMSDDAESQKTHMEEACDAYGHVVAGEIEGADVDLVKMALLEKARCEKKLGRMDEALADFAAIRTYYPDTRFEVDAALEMGDYSFRAKQYSDALKSFERAIKVAKSLGMPDLMAISYYWMGWANFSEGSRIEAQSSPEMIKTSRKLYEKSIDAFQDSIKNTEKYWKKEGREIKRSKELEVYHGEALFRIGRSYQKLMKWNDAIKAFGKTPRVYKEWWLKGLAEVAVSRERKGDEAGSMEKWDELKREISLARVPNIELELLLRRADSIFDLQRYAESEAAYREIITKHPDSADDPRARVNLGLSLFKQGKNREAIQVFAVMLDKYGRDDGQADSVGEALFWKGYLLARIGTEDNFIGDLTQAIRDYKELVTRFPTNTRADDAQFEIGFCTYSLGGSNENKYSEAIQEYSKVLQNYPASEYSDDALFEIGRCYRLLGNAAKEEESLRQLVQDYSTSELADNALLRIAEMHFERAQATESSQERQIAESAYSDIILKYPDTESEAIAHFQMGSILYSFDGSFQSAASEFGRCARVTGTLLDKVAAGGYVPADLDVASLANLLLRSTFWQGESIFQLAKQSEDQAQPADSVRQGYGQARGIYLQLLDRGTKLRNDFPDTTQNLYSIMGGENLDIPIVGEAQYMIGRCLYKEGDMSGAKSNLQPIQVPERLKMKADYLLASIAYEQGQLDNARTMAENWLDNDLAQEMADEYNVGIQVLLAKIALASGNVAEAKAQALDTWALFKTISGLWEESSYLVAKCYQQENDIEKAKTWFEKLEDSYLERWRAIGRGAIIRLPEE